MGQASNKYHVNSEGEIFKVNDDGSFTSLGNAENKNKGIDKHRLLQIENKLIRIGEMDIFNNPEICVEDIKYIARYSQNSDALLIASHYDDGDIFAILVKRFEKGATFLEDAVLNGAQFEDNAKVKLALAQCRRKFNDDDILQTLAKDKNSEISNAAKSNPNFVNKSGGCIGIMVLLIISTISIYLF